MNILKKISPKLVMKKPVKNFMRKELGEERKLYMLVGSADGFIDKDTNFGVSTALTGTFQGFIYDDDGGEGDRFVCYKECYIADEYAEHIKSQLMEEDTIKVDFAFDVSIITVLERGKDAGELSYEYQYNPLAEIETSDPLGDLERLVRENNPALLEGPDAEVPPKTKKKARKKKARS